jgi:hypothetical protein
LAPAPVIDPRLLPSRRDDDDDDDVLSDPATIAKSRGLKPATKVGGVRQVDKGKKRARTPVSDSDSDAAPPAKRGRPKGSSNFNDADTNEALDLAEKFRPMGGKGWAKVARHHNKWARRSNRPVRDAKSIENKYKTVRLLPSLFFLQVLIHCASSSAPRSPPGLDTALRRLNALTVLSASLRSALVPGRSATAPPPMLSVTVDLPPTRASKFSPPRRSPRSTLPSHAAPRPRPLVAIRS